MAQAVKYAVRDPRFLLFTAVMSLDHFVFGNRTCALASSMLAHYEEEVSRENAYFGIACTIAWLVVRSRLYWQARCDLHFRDEAQCTPTSFARIEYRARLHEGVTGLVLRDMVLHIALGTVWIVWGGSMWGFSNRVTTRFRFWAYILGLAAILVDNLAIDQSWSVSIAVNVVFLAVVGSLVFGSLGLGSLNLVQDWAYAGIGWRIIDAFDAKLLSGGDIDWGSLSTPWKSDFLARFCLGGLQCVLLSLHMWHFELQMSWAVRRTKKDKMPRPKPYLDPLLWIATIAAVGTADHLGTDVVEAGFPALAFWRGFSSQWPRTIGLPTRLFA
jgi:hypothetical protein